MKTPILLLTKKKKTCEKFLELQCDSVARCTTVSLSREKSTKGQSHDGIDSCQNAGTAFDKSIETWFVSR